MRTCLPSQDEFHNAGLYFDRCLPVGPDNEKARSNCLDRLASAPTPEVYRSAARKMLHTYQQMGALLVTAQTVGPLALGLGGGGTMEVGCSFHRVYGVAAPLGSGIKGAMRRTLLNAQGLTGKMAGYKPDMKRDQAVQQLGLDEANAAKLHAMLDVFGSVEAAACIDVHDAWVFTEGKYLMRDVVTVHHPAYYQGRALAPSEEDDPVPVAFLSIRPGVEMVFPILCPPDWKPQVYDLLKATLEQTGLGAKTNAGYGRFKVTSPRP